MQHVYYDDTIKYKSLLILNKKVVLIARCFFNSIQTTFVVIVSAI
jgi:hypothetical protein